CFFQAEDGIRDHCVTGVQTCALPISLFGGDFLEGLEIDRSPVFNGWLTAQRRRFRGCYAALLEHLAKSVPDEKACEYLEKWLQLAPFDQRVHEILLAALARHG